MRNARDGSGHGLTAILDRVRYWIPLLEGSWQPSLNFYWLWRSDMLSRPRRGRACPDAALRPNGSDLRPRTAARETSGDGRRCMRRLHDASQGGPRRHHPAPTPPCRIASSGFGPGSPGLESHPVACHRPPGPTSEGPDGQQFQICDAIIAVRPVAECGCLPHRKTRLPTDPRA
jgi:hypothetical protein